MSKVEYTWAVLRKDGGIENSEDWDLGAAFVADIIMTVRHGWGE